jgi:hypothetical protein
MNESGVFSEGLPNCALRLWRLVAGVALERSSARKGPSDLQTVSFSSRQFWSCSVVVSCEARTAGLQDVFHLSGGDTSAPRGEGKDTRIVSENYGKGFFVNKTNRCTEFRFYWYYNSMCFGQSFCPSSGVLSPTSAWVTCMQFCDRVLPGAGCLKIFGKGISP